jgi:hypothetical protein
MGLDGGFYGFGLWKMKFLNIPYFFAGKKPTSNVLYNFSWVQEDERRARTVNPAEKKIWMQQGLNL